MEGGERRVAAGFNRDIVYINDTKSIEIGAERIVPGFRKNLQLRKTYKSH